MNRAIAIPDKLLTFGIIDALKRRLYQLDDFPRSLDCEGRRLSIGWNAWFWVRFCAEIKEKIAINCTNFSGELVETFEGTGMM